MTGRCNAVLVAIGANLPGPRGEHPWVACKAAVAALSDLPGLSLVAVSRWYVTAAVPRSDQPDYVNGAVRLEGTAEPGWLLARLLAIEAQAGRVRGAANVARTLDLDLLAMDGLVRRAPDPILPHPRLQERGFVLAPLADIAPQWRHPVLGRSVAEMLAALPAESRFML